MANHSTAISSDINTNPIKDVPNIKPSNECINNANASKYHTVSTATPNVVNVSNTPGNNSVRTEIPAPKHGNQTMNAPFVFFHPYTMVNPGGGGGVPPPPPPQNYSPMMHAPRGMYPQMYPPAQPYPMPGPFYGSHVYVPHSAYRPRIPIHNHNNIMRTTYWESQQNSVTSTQFKPKTNEAINDAFITALKEAHNSGPPHKPKEVSNKEKVVVANDKKPEGNSSSSAFASLLQSIPKPPKISNDNKETPIAQLEKSTKEETVPITEVDQTPKSNVDDAPLESHDVIRHTAHQDTVPFATCEYGLEIEGIKTYNIEEMLSIRSKMTYDTQKMIQTLSKFRIAIKVQLPQKSGNVWRSISEKKELGLVTDQALFNHSLMQILNKITASNFNQNLASFKLLKFTSPDVIKTYAQMLFEKVIGEHSWSYVYVELVKVTVQYFKECFNEQNYASIFTSTLNEIIEKGLLRDMDVENSILELKKMKTKNIDEIDRLIAETAEKEFLYRKNQFGVALFVSHLHYIGFIDQCKMDAIMKQYESYNDSFGIELYCFMLHNVAHKYLSDTKLKEELSEHIDTLNNIIIKDPKAVTSRAKFAIMDLAKLKFDKFKNLPPRLKISKVTDQPNKTSSSSVNVSSNIGMMNGHESLKRTISIESNSMLSRTSGNKPFGYNRGRESRFRNDVNDSRKVNPDAFNPTGRGKNFGKTRGVNTAGVPTNMQRYAHYEKNFDVSLDDENVALPNASSVTSRTNLDSKPISILKRPSQVQVEDTNITDDTLKQPLNKVTTQINNKSNVRVTNKLRKYISLDTTSSSTDRPTMLSSQLSSVDTDNAKENDMRNLCESAQNLIINFHTKDTNVSRFIIELFNHALSDNMNIFLKEAFTYYSGVSYGHYIFGLLLNEMLGRQHELIPLVSNHIKNYLNEFSLNALDEPVLWDYFFSLIFPILAGNKLTLDHIYKLLSETPDVTDPDEIIIKMLEFGEKRFAIYDTSKLIAHQRNTKFWINITKNAKLFEIVTKITKKLSVLGSGESNDYLHWVDIFLDVKYDGSFVMQSFHDYYTNPCEGLKDLAKSLYLNANIGDKFTNDLIFIFEKRSPEFMDKLFGKNSSRRLLCYVAEAFAQFKFTPHGVIVDIGVPLFKKNHVDKEWLISWKEEDKPSGLSNIDSDIYKIIKSNIK